MILEAIPTFIILWNWLVVSQVVLPRGFEYEQEFALVAMGEEVNLFKCNSPSLP